MIRVGRYDAFDKWEILCRYWQDVDSVSDIGVDKFGRPRLPEWHANALRAGLTACSDYVWIKTRALGPMSEPTGSCGDVDDVGAELWRLLREIGYDELQARARRLAEAVTERGFRAA